MVIFFGFKELVGKWLEECEVEGWGGYVFMRKLGFSKEKLTSWNREVFGDIRARKGELIRDIVELDKIEK